MACSIVVMDVLATVYYIMDLISTTVRTRENPADLVFENSD